MQNLYAFYWDCRRSGDLEGLFIADPEDVKASIGKEVYFGEVLGKHSEIYGTIDEGDISLISDDQEKVAIVQSLFKCSTLSGLNPLLHIQNLEE